MATDTVIYDALCKALNDASLGYNIGWQAVDFEPPSEGVWLEVFFQPNSSLDNGLAYTDQEVPRGFMTIMVMGRPAKGLDEILAASEAVKAVYPKGLTLSGLVRVIRAPSKLDIEPEPDKIGLGLSIEYSG